MIAGFGRVKRHFALFQAFRQMPRNLRVVLFQPEGRKRLEPACRDIQLRYGVTLGKPQLKLKLFLLLIFLLRVDRPDILLIDAPRENVVDGGHRCQHGMILVIVFVHAVAPHQKQVREAVQVFA